MVGGGFFPPFKVELLKVDFSTMILGVENFHHRGGNIGPPIEVEFSTIFIYSALISKFANRLTKTAENQPRCIPDDRHPRTKPGNVFLIFKQIYRCEEVKV